MSDLENRLKTTYDELGIIPKQRESLDYHLSLLKEKDLETYNHSIRVGLKSKEVAEYINEFPTNALFYPGLLHDIGKVKTNLETLQKKEGFDKNDMKELRKHVLDGYNMLKDIHNFSARVLLYHHSFQKKSYPLRFPKEASIEFPEENDFVLRCARLLSIVDFYDAVNSRNNNKFSSNEEDIVSVDREQAKYILLKENVDQAYLIEELYKEGIFE